MLPEKVYMYMEKEDTVVCLDSFKEEETHSYTSSFNNLQRFYITKEYKTHSFKALIEIDDDELNDWENTTDLFNEHTVFKSLQCAKNFREKLILEKYFWYQNKLYCNPKLIGEK